MNGYYYDFINFIILSTIEFIFPEKKRKETLQIISASVFKIHTGLTLVAFTVEQVFPTSFFSIERFDVHANTTVDIIS